MKLEPVGLATIGGGAACEMFDRELARVLADIDDPNTQATAPRTITLKITLAPAESRDAAGVVIDCKAKLAGLKPQAAVVHLVEHGTRRVALGRDPNQIEAFTTVQGGGGE